MSVLEEIINSEFETKDDLVVKLGEAVQEHNDLQKDFDEVREKADRLEAENNELKSKNVELLSMLPIVKEQGKEEAKEELEDEIELEDILKADLERGDE